MKQVLDLGRVYAAILLLALTFAACGGNGGSDGPEETPTRTPSGTPEATVTATPTLIPGDCPSPEDVTFALVVDPPSPRVGDAVTLTFSVHGSGGIPQYMLRGAERYLDGDTSARNDTNFGDVVYELVAAQAGTAFLELSVTYEIMECPPGEGPVFRWAAAVSPPFPVVIGE